MRRFVAGTFALAMLVVFAPFAQEGPSVRIVSPDDGEPALGEVEVAVDAWPPAAVAEVEVQLDGRTVGLLTAEPYRLTVDLGDEPASHRLTAVARSAGGAEARHTVTTVPLSIGTEIEVNLQQLYVTVSDGEGRILDLDEPDFTVLDEGERQEIVTFERGDVPFTAAVLIDASASMQGDKLAAACAGARQFVGGMAELDQAKVVVAADTLLASTPFTQSQQVLTASLGAVEARGGTAVNDALYVLLQLLGPRQGRRVVILLSDGVDTHSALPVEAVASLTRRAQTLVYWIRLPHREGAGPVDTDDLELSSAWRGPADYRRQLDRLAEIVSDSGGRIIPVETVAEVAPVFGEILRELREQYVLGYYPSTEAGTDRWHDVRVRVDRPGAAARTHDGYLEPGPASP